MVTLTDQADPDQSINAYTNEQNYYEIQIQETGLDDVDMQHHGSFNWVQKYPNPFNAATQIMFNLQENFNVTLNIYNA